MGNVDNKAGGLGFKEEREDSEGKGLKTENLLVGNEVSNTFFSFEHKLPRIRL